MSDIWFTLHYREKLQDKYSIKVHNYKEDPVWISTIIEISQDWKKLGEFLLSFPKIWIKQYSVSDHLLDFMQSKSKRLVENIIRDLLYETGVKNILRVTISIDQLDEEHKNKIYQDDNGRLDFERNPLVIAKENKIARELVLRKVFLLQNKWYNVDSSYLIQKCEYFENAIQNAIKSLISKKYIDEDNNRYRLSYLGSIYIENKLLSPYNDKIFLIAACNDNTYKLIDKVYQPAVEELKYELKFQEKSEPKGTIHEDIWEFINKCNVIICDLTGKRPNCFIEYGYALAKNKHIILCVEESEGKSSKGYLKVPFDTQNQKYSFWRKEWLRTNNNTKLKKFRDEIQERVQMKLQIIDTESNI